MKMHRWIFIPLTFAIAYAVIYTIFGLATSIGEVAGWFVMGATLGFILQFWSDFKTKGVSDGNGDDVHQVKRRRTLTLMLDREKSLELCKAAVESLGNAKIKSADPKNGTLKATTRMTWNSFGQAISFRLTAINENLTDVEILTSPVVRTTIIDYGEGWKYIEHICDFLRTKDAEINHNVLKEGIDLLHEIYVKKTRKKSEML